MKKKHIFERFWGFELSFQILSHLLIFEEQHFLLN